MAKSSAQVMELLDTEDKDKVAYFINLLLSQAKYRKLKKEIAKRRAEIKKGDSLTHSDFWNKLNV